MKHLLIFIAFIGVISPVISQVKYTNPEKDFSITFPVAPQYSPNTTEVEDEILTLHNYIANLENTFVFMVSTVDFSSSITNSKEESKQILVNAAVGFFGSLNIQLRNEKEVKTGKYKGLQFHGDNSAYYLYYRVFLIDGTLYQLAVMGVNAETPKKQRETFFKTFKVLKK